MEEPIMRDPDKQGSKTGGGGYTPPGGTGITPGGGFGATGFFGAERGAPLGDFFGSGPGMRPKRRVVMGPNGPISVAASPMSSDTVPAMLTPGEGVLNVGAMQQPGMTDFLQAANQQGVKQMSEGGMVGGGIDKEMILKLLHLLLDDDGGEDVQGFAWGGMVRPQMGGGMRQQAPTAPRMPAQPLGVSQASGTQPNLFGGSLNRFMRGSRGIAPGAMPQVGPLTGPSTTPDNPWGNDPFAPGSQNPGDENMARIWKMLQGFGEFGSFSPEGSKGLMDAVRGEATSNADALRRRAAMNADVQGLDAGQKGAYAMQSDLNTQGDVAKTLNNATLQQLLGQQQFGQNMLGKAYDANTQAWLARLASWMKGG